MPYACSLHASSADIWGRQVGHRAARGSSGVREGNDSAPPINLSGIQFRRPHSAHYDGEYANGEGEPSGLDTVGASLTRRAAVC
jgi:hypothetical protein